jgi:putative ATP-binding cassette transporter
MPASDEDASGQDGGLGDQLLKLIPPVRKADSKPRQTARSALAQLLRLGAEESLGQLMLVAVLSALCGTGVLFLLNAEAKEIEQHHYSTLTAVLFIGLLVLYRGAQSRLIRTAAGAIEAALDHKRQRVVADVLQLSLRDIELIEGSKLRDGIAAHYRSLSQTLVPLIAGAEALLLLVFMFAYVLSLSIFAGVLTLVVVGVTVAGYLNRNKQMEAEMRAVSAADARFLGLSDAIVGGAKELQLSLGLRIGLQEAMQASSAALAKGRSATAAHFADLIATGTTISYMIAGAVVFVMPLVVGQGDEDISRIVVAVIFLLGPIGSVVQTAQQFTTAQYALSAINAFEADVADRKAKSAELSECGAEPEVGAHPTFTFEDIAMDRLRYVHVGQKSFAIEDVNLSLRKGEIVFLTGGNGSGKTTLLRVLTGLYPRTDGALRLNDQAVSMMPPQAYRELFAGVFADFHLFDQPFGLDEAGIFAFDRWLVELGIRDKLGADVTQIAADQLSTGQRKRVALALALAQVRPILVLDEWAADQDPETRRRFYEEILPALRAEGRTIFAITHDEKYFQMCDRRMHMVEGRLIQWGPQ